MLPVMKALYVPLPAETLDELARVAARCLRTPRQQATYMLVEALAPAKRRAEVRRVRTPARRSENGQ
jgi:hypothetical protein